MFDLFKKIRSGETTETDAYKFAFTVIVIFILGTVIGFVAR